MTDHTDPPLGGSTGVYLLREPGQLTATDWLRAAQRWDDYAAVARTERDRDAYRSNARNLRAKAAAA